MAEAETHIAALELSVTERLAPESPPLLRGLKMSLSVTASGDENVVRTQALQILADAAGRYEAFNIGEMLKRPPED